MSDGRRRAIALLSLLALVSGCANRVSDTGFTGAWRRDTLSGVSVVSFRPSGEDWSVGWHLDGDERRIRCDADGVCDEINGGEVVYRWTLSAERRPDDDALYVTRAGEPILTGTTALSEVLRFELEDDGLGLRSFVVARNGAPLARPAGPYRYTKLSDDPDRTDP